MSEEQKQQEEKKQKEKKEEEPKKEPKKEVKEEVEIEVPKKFQKLVEEIEKMSVLDLAELVKILEKKFGVSAAAPITAAVVPGGVVGEGAEAEEEKSSFNIELTETGGNKIGVIKALREITQKGLKECKDMTEGAPLIIKEGAKKEEAEEMKKKLEAVGAKVTLK